MGLGTSLALLLQLKLRRETLSRDAPVHYCTALLTLALPLTFSPLLIFVGKAGSTVILVTCCMRALFCALTAFTGFAQLSAASSFLEHRGAIDTYSGWRRRVLAIVAMCTGCATLAAFYFDWRMMAAPIAASFFIVVATAIFLGVGVVREICRGSRGTLQPNPAFDACTLPRQPIKTQNDTRALMTHM